MSRPQWACITRRPSPRRKSWRRRRGFYKKTALGMHNAKIGTEEEIVEKTRTAGDQENHSGTKTRTVGEHALKGRVQIRPKL